MASLQMDSLDNRHLREVIAQYDDRQYRLNRRSVKDCTRMLQIHNLTGVSSLLLFLHIGSP